MPRVDHLSAIRAYPSIMYPIDVSIAAAPASRNRVTVLLRLFMLIPHVIVLYAFQIGASIVAFIHWLIIVFTGKRNEAMQDFTARYLGYATAVAGYGALLHDEFPAFGSVADSSPVTISTPPAGEGNRITTLFRILLAIPVSIICGLIGIAVQVLAIASWFVIVFTGKQPDGMREFIAKGVRYGTQVQGYTLLLTDVYPWPSATGFSV